MQLPYSGAAAKANYASERDRLGATGFWKTGQPGKIAAG
jgi:hypothetical protein